uniref:Uncharacterized protein n=1 Tax=Arundo donax TaxID=35708 RepID=A0A0A8YH23_ARUDO
MGSAEGQVLCVACLPQPMLDGGSPHASRTAASESLPALRPT